MKGRHCPERDVAISQGLTEYFTGKPCRRGHLSKRMVKGHKCIACEEAYKSQQYHKKYDAFESALITRKRSAEKKGLACDITIDQIHKPTHCPVLGIELCYERTSGYRKPNKAVIDKFVPELGYTAGNVFVISSRANQLKSNGTVTEFEQLLEWMKQIEQSNKTNGNT